MLKEPAMSDAARTSNYKKIVEFIPFKTLSMDLESILASLAKIYVNRNDTDVAELIALSEAELFPIGSFDPEAIKYEYVLKLAVPVKFFNHLKNDIEKIQRQLLRDITAVIAPYLHEFIAEVFVVIKIEQDSKWREAILDCIEAGSMAAVAHAADSDFTLFHAPSDGSGVAAEMKKVLCDWGFTVSAQVLTSVKDKDIHAALKDFEKNSRFGVCIISKAFMGLPLSKEAIGLIVSYVLDPGKRFFQVWDNVGRADVADFNAGLARSLAVSTERMSVETICDYLLQLSGLK